MLTSKGCGRCALDKRKLDSLGILSIIDIQDAVSNPLLVESGFRSVPIYLVQNDVGEVVFKTQNLKEFLEWMYNVKN